MATKEKTVLSLEIDSPSKIFDFLKKRYDGENEKKVITGMCEYSVIELTIPSGPKAYGCSIGLRIKPHNDGQALCIWVRTPMGTERGDAINVFDPNPFLTLETFSEDIKTDTPGLKLDYKVGTVTSEALIPLLKVVEAVQSAISFTLLEKGVH